MRADNYYDFNVTHGWNRATQQLIDHGQYYGAVQRSSVRAQITIHRCTHQGIQLFCYWLAATYTCTRPIVAGGALLHLSQRRLCRYCAGWVYDPNIPGNGRDIVAVNFSNRKIEFCAARYSQLRLSVDLSKDWRVVNNACSSTPRIRRTRLAAFWCVRMTRSSRTGWNCRVN